MKTSYLIVSIALFSGALIAGGYYFQQAEQLQTKLEAAKSELTDLRRQVSSMNENEVQTLKEQLQQAGAEIEQLEVVKVDLESQLRQAIAAGEVALEKQQNTVVITLLDKVLFTPADAHITSQGETILQQVGSSLSEFKKITILGHTDSWPIAKKHREKYPSNWELAALRAVNVAKYFKQAFNVPGEKLEAASASYYRPIADNSTEEGRAQNRRIEIYLEEL